VYHGHFAILWPKDQDRLSIVKKVVVAPPPN